MNSARSLNLKHLRYFVEVARRGSVTAAARTLFVAPQTVSGQVLALEESVGQPLFERIGRSMKLTTAGETALDYAGAIFALGDELGDVLRGARRARNQSLRVGVTDSVPKLLTVRLLQPVVSRHADSLDLSCREGTVGELLGQITAGELDVLLTDTPLPPNLARTLHVRVVADSGLSFVAAKRLAKSLARRFPGSLDGAPYVAGASPSSLQEQAIEAWFVRKGIRPRSAGRIDDSALLKGFAQQGLGVITVPTTVESEVLDHYGLGVVGRTEDVRQQVFLVRTRGRRVHPLVQELEGGAA